MTTEHQITKVGLMLENARLNAESVDEDVIRLSNDLICEATRIRDNVQDGMGTVAHVGSTAEKLAVAVAQRDAAYQLINRLEALS